jgi:hypothetical protein
VYDYEDPLGGSHLLEAATLIPIGKIAKGAKLAERGLSVIGHYPDYLKRAEELGARRFDVAMRSSWRRRSIESDRAAREIGYLLERGYTVAPGGSRLLPP